MSQRTPNKLNFNGRVLGYDYNPSKGIFKKNEQITLEGSLAGVKLELSSGGKSISTKTSDSGVEFAFGIEIGKKYKLAYNKTGYGNSAVEIDLRSVPEDMAASGLVLHHMELILNDFESDKPADNGSSFGRIYYSSSSRTFEFKPTVFDSKERLFKKDEDNTQLNLLKTSIRKNREKNKHPESNPTEEITTQKEKKTYTKRTDDSGEIVEIEEENTGEERNLSELLISSFKGFDNLSPDDIENRTKEIEDAWEQLEKDKLLAITEEDFLMIQLREEMLVSAEKELASAQLYIEEQENKISAQSNFIYAMIGLVLLMGALAFILFRQKKEKQKMNTILAAKNQKIMDSIQYAERIQKSVLLSDQQIKSILPKSFIFFQPVDTVSGDFYWLSEVDNKIIIAAVDCTGHGVPGAFMSLIGNTLLNQIVNEKKETQSGVILSKLHDGIVTSLQQASDESLAQDGMDLSLCCIDKSTNELTFSGAMNPLYIVQDNEVKVLSGDLMGIGGTIRNKVQTNVKFSEQKIKLGKDTSIYMFSDGYMDQFGGDNSEKYNIKRFKDLLLSLQDIPMKDQENVFRNTLSDWKGKENQTDDVLVIGAQL
jgi:LPXTG-motif cell wall-anchored protein